MAEGEARARRLARRFGGLAVTAAYTSDLSRARRTAELAGFGSATATPLLREFDYGDYEGLTTAEIRRRRAGWELFRDGCPGGETPAQVYARAERFLALVAAETGVVVAFSHGHFSRALAVAWTRLGIEAGTRLSFDAAAVGQLRDGDHGRVIERWNLST